MVGGAYTSNDTQSEVNERPLTASSSADTRPQPALPVLPSAVGHGVGGVVSSTVVSSMKVTTARASPTNAAAKVGESKKLAPRTTTEVPPALGPKRGTIDEMRGRAKYSNVRSSSKASPAFFPTPMPTPKSTKPTAPLGDRQINRALASSVASTLFSPK